MSSSHPSRTFSRRSTDVDLLQPGFIGTVLSLPTHLARVYFPYVLALRVDSRTDGKAIYSADANTATSVIAHCLKSKNLVNLIVGTKAPVRPTVAIVDTY